MLWVGFLQGPPPIFEAKDVQRALICQGTLVDGNRLKSVSYSVICSCHNPLDKEPANSFAIFSVLP